MEMFASEIELQNEYSAVLVRANQVGLLESVEYSPPPEDVYFISAKDVKGKNEVSLFEQTMPIFAQDKIEYFGQVVGVVVASSEDVAREFASSIKLVIQEESVVALDLKDADLEEILQEHKDKILFEKCKVSEEQDEIEDHIEEKLFKRDSQDEHTDSDADKDSKTFENTPEISEPIVSSFLHFSPRLHYHAEPLTIKVRSKQNGLDVYVATQWAYHVQKTIATAIGENPEKVKVNPTNESYSLNGRVWVPSLFASMIAVASNVLKKNISLVFSFEEMASFSTRSPQVAIRHTSCLTQDKQIKSMSVLCIIDAGAFNLLLNEMATHVLITSLSLYRVPSYNIKVVAIKTKTHLTDLFIGWGEHYTNTAIENHINDIVDAFSFDPIQFRLEHILKQQEKTVTQAVKKDDYKIEAIMDRATKKTTFMRKYAAYRAFNKTFNTVHHQGKIQEVDSYCRGIGLAIALQYNGLKTVIKDGISYSVEMTLTTSEELFIKAEPSMPLLKDILKKRCMKSLNIEASKIIFTPMKNIEPSTIGPSLPSCTSSILPLLLDKCIAELQKQRFRNPLPITVKKDYKITKRSGWNEEELDGQPFISDTAGCCVAELSLERSTYTVKVKNINIVVEAPDAIEKDYIISTVNRVVAMALSGVVRERIFPYYRRTSDYTIITPDEMPKIDVEVISSGSSGLKGISNLAFNLVPAAVIAALNQILQANHIKNLPITQQDIFCLIEGNMLKEEVDLIKEEKEEITQTFTGAEYGKEETVGEAESAVEEKESEENCSAMSELETNRGDDNA